MAVDFTLEELRTLRINQRFPDRDPSFNGMCPPTINCFPPFFTLPPLQPVLCLGGCQSWQIMSLEFHQFFPKLASKNSVPQNLVSKFEFSIRICKARTLSIYSICQQRYVSWLLFRTRHESRALLACASAGKFGIITFDEFIQIALTADRIVGIYPECKNPVFINQQVSLQSLPSHLNFPSQI